MAAAPEGTDAQMDASSRTEGQGNAQAPVERAASEEPVQSEMTMDEISHEKSAAQTTLWNKPKTLTVPVSPKFATESRSRLREQTHGHHRSFGSSSSSSHEDRSYVKNQIKTWENRLTVPESPMLATNARVGKRPLETTEELELKRIKAELEERVKRRKIVERVKEKALSHVDFVPQRSVGPLTEPEEFHFRTEERSRMHASVHSFSSSDSDSDGRLSGRKTTSAWTGQLTEPQPFSFHTDERAAMHRGFDSSRGSQHSSGSGESGSSSSSGGGHDEFVSAAEQIRRFQAKTPVRFHTRGKNDHFEPEKYKPTPLQLTQPEEFHFHEPHHRPAQPVLSTAEREELEALRAPKFKANPVDHRIFESRGPIGIKAPEPLPLTVPEEFHFATDGRIKGFDRSQSSTEHEHEQENQLFRAQPFPEHIFKQQPQPVHREPKPLTIPQSPMLATKERAAFAPPPPQPEQPQQFKARPVLHFDSIEIKKSVAPLTQPQPFQLTTEERGRMAQAEMQRRLEEQQRREEQLRQVKANPMPIFDHAESSGELDDFSTVPKKPNPAPLTAPEPFQLATEMRHAMHEHDLKMRLQREREQENRQHEFQAKPYVPVSAPFFAKKSTRPLTDCNEPVLASDQRALAREEFNTRLQEKQLKEQMEAKMAEIQQMEAERKELKKYRKELRHKALPIMAGKPVVVRGSTAPLTVPQSPAFATKMRFGKRDSHE